jgi:hypothetical protein
LDESFGEGEDMTADSELFIAGSRRFYEGLNKVLASVDRPDEQCAHQTFETPKRRIEEVDDLVKSGELDLGVAEERRFRIEVTAWPLAYKRVLNSWDTRDQLDEVIARYRKTVSGAELELSDCEKDKRRKEALSEFENLWLEIAAWQRTPDRGRAIPKVA